MGHRNKSIIKMLKAKNPSKSFNTWGNMGFNYWWHKKPKIMLLSFQKKKNVALNISRDFVG